jgi:protein TonB
MSLVKHSVLKILSLSLALGSWAMLHAATSEGTAFDVRPMPIKTPPPEYPNKLKQHGVTGLVALRVDIDESGAVTDCAVSKSSNADFNEAAIQAVKNWRFIPAQKDGNPIKVRLVIPIHFRLEE